MGYYVPRNISFVTDNDALIVLDFSTGDFFVLRDLSAKIVSLISGKTLSSEMICLLLSNEKSVSFDVTDVEFHLNNLIDVGIISVTDVV